MGNVLRVEGQPRVILHLPDDHTVEGVPEAIDTGSEYYEIHDLYRFDDMEDAIGNAPAVVWFQPKTDTAVIAGHAITVGHEPDMVVDGSLMSEIHTICRPPVEPAEMWVLSALLSGCFASDHEIRYAFDNEGDQYTICIRCGKQTFTGFTAEDEGTAYERSFYPDALLPADTYVLPENLPERQSIFHAGVPILDSQGDVLGTLIIYLAEHDGANSIAFAADEFEEQPCRVTVMLRAEDLFKLISSMSSESARFTFFAVDMPETDEYYELLDRTEWPLGIEWGSLSIARRVTLTYPVTTEYEDDEGRPYEAQVDKALFFIALMAIRQALESSRRQDDEKQMI